MPILKELTKRVETGWSERKSVYKALLRAIPFGMDIVDEEGNILFMNNILKEKYGAKAARHKCWEIYCDNNKQCINCPLLSGISIGKTAKVIAAGVMGGKIVEITHTGMMFRGKKAILEIFEDITHRQKMEKQLIEFSQAVEQSPTTVLITDLEGNIEYANPKFSQLTGYSAEEVKGQNLRILKSGEHPESFYKEMWKTIAGGKEWRGEFHDKKKNGELFWGFSSISSIKGPDGIATHYLSVQEDITERKQTEERLAWLASFPNLDPNAILEINNQGEITYLNRAARLRFPEFAKAGKKSALVNDIFATQAVFKKSKNRYIVKETEYSGKAYELHCSYLEDSLHIRAYVFDITLRKKTEKLKDDFVDTVSHELRTPLSITEGGISLVLDEIPGTVNVDQKKILTNSKESIHRLLRIINDLLDISKIDAGKATLHREVFNISDFVNHVASLFELSVKEVGLTLTPKILVKTETIYADPDKLTQVFTNLIGNAIKFTKKGGIEILVKDNEDSFICSVIDTGQGISKEDLPKVFDKFQQFSRTGCAGGKGTGLGLSIAEGIVEMHGGNIKVESKLEKGTTFTFVLPKLTAKDLLKEEVRRVANEAAKAGSDFSVFLAATNISSKIFKENTLPVLRGIEEVVTKNLRRAADRAFVDFNTVAVLLPECNTAGAGEVKKRLDRALEEHLVENKIAGRIDLELKSISYPEDVSSRERLIKTIDAILEKK